MNCFSLLVVSEIRSSRMCYFFFSVFFNCNFSFSFLFTEVVPERNYVCQELDNVPSAELDWEFGGLFRRQVRAEFSFGGFVHHIIYRPRLNLSFGLSEYVNPAYTPTIFRNLRIVGAAHETLWLSLVGPWTGQVQMNFVDDLDGYCNVSLPLLVTGRNRVNLIFDCSEGRFFLNIVIINLDKRSY